MAINASCLFIGHLQLQSLLALKEGQQVSNPSPGLSLEALWIFNAALPPYPPPKPGLGLLGLCFSSVTFPDLSAAPFSLLLEAAFPPWALFPSPSSTQDQPVKIASDEVGAHLTTAELGQLSKGEDTFLSLGSPSK